MTNHINPHQAAGIPFPQGVLWDMDGVILDSGSIHYDSWVVTMHKYFPQVPFSEEIFKQSFGKNNRLAIPSMVGYQPDPALVDEISDFKENLYRDMLHGRIEFLPGVQDLMQRFFESGIPQAVGTSAPAHNMELIRQELGLDDYLQSFISAAKMPSKPDPAVFLNAAQAISVNPEHCVVFEDAVAGVQAGKTAGAAVIAVTTTNPREQLTMADLVVERLDEIDFASWAGD
jgi:HAD superfamily hydrolase (TIGR01509 family)